MAGSRRNYNPGMGALQPMHLLVILVLALIVFGGGKLGDIGGQLGKGMREFRDVTKDDGPAAAQRFCTQCGAKNDADAKHCTECGVAIG